MREFTTRLTADVMTRQLDVREVAARLPETDPNELAESVIAGVDDDLDEQTEEYLEDVES